MSEDIIVTPIAHSSEDTTPAGRLADRLAMIVAGLGALFSIIAAVWFFLGFAENDTRPEHLASAFFLTLILFAFAIVPFICVGQFARRAYQKGTTRSHFYWTLFLMLPWIFLSSLSMFHTPLPVGSGLIFFILASLLSLWAIVSLVLERKNKVQTQ